MPFGNPIKTKNAIITLCHCISCLSGNQIGESNSEKVADMGIYTVQKD